MGAGKKAWGYYPAGDVWLPLRCNALGQLEVDFALINFTDLADTPAAYAGSALHGLRVNAATNAIEFVDGIFESGATVPAAPVAGSRFLHTPVGRSVLLIYNGASWNPVSNFGLMTVYVDKTQGTDGIDYGGAVDAGAFQTLQYAIDQIPALLLGNVVVNLNDEDYGETVTIRGKQLGGNYGVAVNGQLQVIVADTNMTGGSAGLLAARPTVIKAGAAWGGNAYRGMLCHFTSGGNNGEYRVIHSNTATTLQLCGDILPAGPVNGDRFTIEDWDTTVDSIEVMSGQKAVSLYDIELDHATAMHLLVEGLSECRGERLKSPDGEGFFAQAQASLYLVNSYAYVSAMGQEGVYILRLSYGDLNGVFVRGKGTGLWCGDNSFTHIHYGCTFEGINAPNRMQFGLRSRVNSVINAWPHGRQSNVEWCSTGAEAAMIAGIVNTAQIIYANNTVNENPAGNPDYTYID